MLKVAGIRLSGVPVGDRLVHARLPESTTVTFAMLALSKSRCAVAADSLMVTLDHRGTVLSQVEKTAASAAVVGVVAGIVATPSGSLHEVLRRALDGAASPERAMELFVALAASVFAPHQDQLLSLFDDREVVWEAALGGRDERGNFTCVLLTGYVDGAHIALDVQVRDARSQPLVFVLGARTADLRRLDARYHDIYPYAVEVANQTRADPPVTPLHAQVGDAAELAQLVTRAVAAERTVDRHSWWPDGVPIAAPPVTAREVA